MAVFPTAKSKSPAAAAAAASSLAAPRSLTDSPEFKAADARMATLESELTAAKAEAEDLQRRLGRDSTLDATTLEAMALLGEDVGDDANAAAEVSVRHARLLVVHNRARVLETAIKLHEPILNARRLDAARAIVKAATPAWRAALVSHAEDVVQAARSRLAALRLVEGVDVSVGQATLAGIADETFALLGDVRESESNVCRWVRDLIGYGILTGNEAWLKDVALIARRPDGSGIDRADLYAKSFQPPEYRPTPTPRLNSAVAAPVASPAPVASIAPLAPPVPKGPTKRIRVLKEMATVDDFYAVGDVAEWDAADASALVKNGTAEWVDTPPSPSSVATLAGAATSGT